MSCPRYRRRWRRPACRGETMAGTPSPSTKGLTPTSPTTDLARLPPDALAAGGLWDRVAIFITWDDWGGWYDHVDPPVVETWDHTHAQRGADALAEFDGQPFRYGSRVPCLVVGPYAKPGHISRQLNSHVSLLKFCEDLFGIDPLTDRDGAANGMSDCIDLSQVPNPHP